MNAARSSSGLADRPRRGHHAERPGTTGDLHAGRDGCRLHWTGQPRSAAGCGWGAGMVQPDHHRRPLFGTLILAATGSLAFVAIMAEGQAPGVDAGRETHDGSGS